jgi:4-hydroxybenzoate polyprenyltransferase
VKNIRSKKPFVIPQLLTGLCFVSAYLYLSIVSKNIPIWIYIFIGIMVAYGVYSTVKKIKDKSKAA